MAFNDIKSTNERLNALKNIRTLIDESIKNARIAQRYYSSEIGEDNYGDFDILWEGVILRLALSESAAEIAKDELLSLIDNDGFVFKYEWIIGKRNITGFTFDAAADTAVIVATNAVVQNAGVVLVGGDYCVISGTTSNDGQYAVDTGSASSTIEFISGIADETCTTPGAKITLIARVA